MYSPTVTDEEVEMVYAAIADRLKQVKKEDINLIKGDFNAKATIQN